MSTKQVQSDAPTMVMTRRLRCKLPPPPLTTTPTKMRPPTPSKPTGLRNLGNTCFLNAVMQALMHINAFREYFLNRAPTVFLEESPGSCQQGPSNTKDFSRRDALQCFKEACSRGRKSNDPTETALWLELHNLFRVLTSGKWSIVTPHSMVNALWHFLPCFRGCTQQDAQEFLFFIFDRLEKELQVTEDTVGSRPSRKSGQSRESNRKTNAIRRLFEGRLLSKVTCQKCNTLTEKEEPFLDVSLQIPKQHHCTVGPRRSTRHQPQVQPNVPSCTLEECFHSYARAELLPGNYMCENCKEQTSALKKLSFAAAPDVLCIVLKRFAYNPETCISLKVDTHVTFPLSGLKLSPWMHSKNGKMDMTASPVAASARPPRMTPSISRSLFGMGMHLTRASVSFNDPSAQVNAERLSSSCAAWDSVYHHPSPPSPPAPDLDSDVDELRPPKRAKLRGCTGPVEPIPTPRDAYQATSMGVSQGPPAPDEAEEKAYNLRAIIVHHGKGLQTGHYTAYCWNASKEQWIHFNDAELQPEVPPSEILQSQAYILFYDRTS